MQRRVVVTLPPMASYRMDHLPLIIGQHHGSEGFALHGGPLSPGR
jgi:hypothetical protein